MNQLTQQRGATLVISLTMITAVTLMAIVALQRVTVQQKMVNNIQISELVFNTGMNELEAKYGRFANEEGVTQTLADAVNNPEIDAEGNVRTDPVTGKPLYKPLPLQAEANLSRDFLQASVQLQYLGTGGRLPRGFASDSSQNRFVNHKFELNTRVEAGDSFQSNQILGLNYLAPKGQ